MEIPSLNSSLSAGKLPVHFDEKLTQYTGSCSSQFKVGKNKNSPIIPPTSKQGNKQIFVK
jgi:hypothetical protein